MNKLNVDRLSIEITEYKIVKMRKSKDLFIIDRFLKAKR